MKTTTKPHPYPFNKLQVGESFLVWATEEQPEPWKTFGPTVSSAIRRYPDKHFSLHQLFCPHYTLIGAVVIRRN
jgi:hypothetical protein